MKKETLIELIPKIELERYRLQVKNGETPLWSHWPQFVEHYLREGRSEYTLKGVRDTLKLLIKHMGILTIEKCNTPHVLREAMFEMKEKRNWQAETFNTYRKNLNTFFLWLRNMEYIDENKIGKIGKCSGVIKEQHVLNEEQIKIIRTHIMSGRRNTRLERWRNLFLFELMVLTGARPCEIENMQCMDIRCKENSYEILIRGKKQKGRIRYYDMPSSLRDTYEMYIKSRQELGREETHLFCSQSKRTGFTYKGIQGLYKKLSKELKFTINSYAIRRFVATRLNSQGVDIKDIQNYLGHTRATTTQRYIERSCGLTKNGMKKMQQLFD